MTTNQEQRLASVQSRTGTSLGYEGDLLTLFASEGYTTGTFNERFLSWINGRLGVSYTSLPRAMSAYAASVGVTRWSDVTSVGPGIGPSPSGIIVNVASASGSVDLSRFTIGQGGLSSGRMTQPITGAIKSLRPKQIRLFIQEYYGINPSAGVYSWTKFDPVIQDILDTGALPYMNICNKPAYMFTGLPDATVVTPNSWIVWKTMVTALVNHVSSQFGLTGLYWEVMNEPENGESGGCPYLFPSDGVALEAMYANTRAAILAADSTAKVGGMAFVGESATASNFFNVAHANGDVFDFVSIHRYTSDPNLQPSDLQAALDAAGYSSGSIPEYLTEWNTNFNGTFSNAEGAAYVCVATAKMQNSLYTVGSHFYHLQDVIANATDFNFMASDIMQTTWTGAPISTSLGMHDYAGNRLSYYFALKYLRNIVGNHIPLTINSDVCALACVNGASLDAVLWNYSSGATYNLALFTATSGYGYYELVRINQTNAVEDVIASGEVSTLSTQISASLPFAQYDTYYLKTRPVSFSTRRPSFTASVFGSNPATQNITISYNGLSPSSSFTVTSDSAWLTVTPVSGSGNGQVFQLSADVSSFTAPGSQCAFVSVSRAGLDTTLLEVDLTLTPAWYAAPTQTILALTQPTHVAADAASYEMGVKFVPAVNGHVTGVAFFRLAGLPSSHVGKLWDNSGTLLGTTPTLTAAQGSFVGWQALMFASPIAVTAGQTYTASVNQPADGIYPAASHVFDSPITNGNLTAPAGAGVFNVTLGSWPTTAFNNTSYFRDVLFITP